MESESGKRRAKSLQAEKLRRESIEMHVAIGFSGSDPPKGSIGILVWCVRSEVCEEVDTRKDREGWFGLYSDFFLFLIDYVN